MSLKQEERDIMVALEMEKADVNGDNKVNAADIVDVTNEIK
jgi:hypothetical protein